MSVIEAIVTFSAFLSFSIASQVQINFVKSIKNKVFLNVPNYDLYSDRNDPSIALQRGANLSKVVSRLNSPTLVVPNLEELQFWDLIGLKGLKEILILKMEGKKLEKEFWFDLFGLDTLSKGKW